MAATGEATLNTLIDGISNSRLSIQDSTSKILHQLERLGFYKPAPQVATHAGNGLDNAGPSIPRERTALEGLETQAVELNAEADTLNQICNLLNSQF